MEVTGSLFRGLDGHILASSVHYHASQLPRGILFVTETEPPRQGYICITSRQVLDKVLPCQPAGEFYIFLTVGEVAEPLPDLPGVTCVQTDLSYATLYNLLHDALRRLEYASPDSEPDHSFPTFLQDIISMKITRTDEIEARFCLLPHVNKLPYRIFYFEFDTLPVSTMQGESLVKELRGLFPFSNACYRFDRLVLLTQLSSPAQDSIRLPEATLASLLAICQKYSVCCAYSCNMQNFSMLRTEYLYAKDTLRIGKKMRKKPNQRIFRQEDYFAYLTMDLALREFDRTYHHSKYIYLLHPGLSRILWYDRHHDGNLRSVFFYYLLLDRNLTKTAEAVHMHRNTVIYKVEKALELVEDDVDSPLIRQRLLWSFMMMEYFEKVLGISSEEFPDYNN